PGRLLLGRLAGRGRAADLRALPGAAGRPLAPRRGVLQRPRLHRGDRAGARGNGAVASLTKAESVRAMFTRIAGRYDLMNSLMTGGRHPAWRRAATDAVACEPPGTAP